MMTLKRYMQIIGMMLAIWVLYYIPTDGLSAYALPMVGLGVILILSYTFYTLKKRGLWAFVFGLIFMMSSASQAYEIIDCGGTYTQSGQSIINAIQDSAGGNYWESDFKDKDVLACVIVNIANLKNELCNTKCDPDDDTYDQALRNKAFYVMDNYYRMNNTEATDDADRGWIEDAIEKSGNEALKAAQKAAGNIEVKNVSGCANKYIECAAKIDRKNEADCGNVMTRVKEESKDCWVCDIVQLVIESVQLMAGNTYQLMQYLALRLLGVILLFWIAIKVLIFIGHMGYADNGEFMTDLLVRFIVVAIAAAILHAPIIDFYRVAISPFVNLSAALASKFTEMSMADGEKTFAEITEGRAGAVAGDICVYCENMNDPNYTFPRKRESLPESQGNVVHVEVLDPQTINGILCLTCKVYRQVVPFIAIGEMFTCHANATAYRIPLTSIYVPNFPYLIVGWLIIIPFSILAVIIGFYLIDIVLRLGFVIVLTPLYITAWAFPISREYSTKAWHLILYSLLQFIGVAVMIALFLNMCLQIIPGGSPANLLDAMAANDIEKMFRIVTGMDPLIAGAGMVVIAATSSAIGSFLLIFMLAAFLFIAIKMLMATEKVVENLSGISLGIPGVALGAMTAMIKGAVSLAGKAGGAAVKVASKATDSAKKGYDKAQEKAKNKASSGKGGGKSAPKRKFGGKDGGKGGGKGGSGGSNGSYDDQNDNQDQNNSQDQGGQDSGQNSTKDNGKNSAQDGGKSSNESKNQAPKKEGKIKGAAKAMGASALDAVRHPFRTTGAVLRTAVAIPKKVAELPGKMLSTTAEKVGGLAGTLAYKVTNGRSNAGMRKGYAMMAGTGDRIKNQYSSKINLPTRIAVMGVGGFVAGAALLGTSMVVGAATAGASKTYGGVKSVAQKMGRDPKTSGSVPSTNRTKRVPARKK